MNQEQGIDFEYACCTPMISLCVVSWYFMSVACYCMYAKFKFWWLLTSDETDTSILLWHGYEVVRPHVMLSRKYEIRQSLDTLKYYFQFSRLSLARMLIFLLAHNKLMFLSHPCNDKRG
jgi:hypothetical protein